MGILSFYFDFDVFDCLQLKTLDIKSTFIMTKSSQLNQKSRQNYY